MAKRPLLITLLGALYMIFGLLMFLGGIGAAFFGAAILVPASLPAGMAAGAAMALFGLISVIIGYGLLQGWAIMWYLAVIFSLISLLGSLLSLPGGLVGAVIFAVVLYYLFRPTVKRFFKI